LPRHCRRVPGAMVAGKNLRPPRPAVAAKALRVPHLGLLLSLAATGEGSLRGPLASPAADTMPGRCHDFVSAMVASAGSVAELAMLCRARFPGSVCHDSVSLLQDQSRMPAAIRQVCASREAPRAQTPAAPGRELMGVDLVPLLLPMMMYESMQASIEQTRNQTKALQEKMDRAAARKKSTTKVERRKMADKILAKAEKKARRRNITKAELKGMVDGAAADKSSADAPGSAPQPLASGPPANGRPGSAANVQPRLNASSAQPANASDDMAAASAQSANASGGMTAQPPTNASNASRASSASTALREFSVEPKDSIVPQAMRIGLGIPGFVLFLSAVAVAARVAWSLPRRTSPQTDRVPLTECEAGGNLE